MPSLLTLKDTAKAQRVLCYGAPKSGKTCQVGELAKKFKVLYLDLEDSVDSLFLVCSDEQLANIEYIRVADTPSDPKAVTTVTRLAEQRKGYICETHSDWNCPMCRSIKDQFFQIDLDNMPPDEWIVVIDSGTQFALSALFHTCKANNVDFADADDKATYAMWRAQGAYLDKLFSTFQTLNVNLYVTAHEIEVTMPDKSKKLAPSMGTRNYAASVGKYFGHVIRLTRSSAGHKGSSMTVTTGAEAGSRWGIDYNTASMLDFFIRPTDLPRLDLQAASRPVVPAASAGTTKLGGGNLLNKFKK